MGFANVIPSVQRKRTNSALAGHVEELQVTLEKGWLMRLILASCDTDLI